MMPPAAESLVLDTSALFCLKQNEPGAADVEGILRRHGRKGTVFISFMSMMELAYILEQEQGEAAARLGATLVHKDPEFKALAQEIQQRLLPFKWRD